MTHTEQPTPTLTPADQLSPTPAISREEAESLLDNPTDPRWHTQMPNLGQPCYDCGSVIAGHHTTTCDMTGEGDQRDLTPVGDSGFPPQAWVRAREFRRMPTR